MRINEITKDTSVYEILRASMTDGLVNFVRVGYAGKAAQPVMAWFRSQTGETTSDEGISHLILDRFVSSNRTNLNLVLGFDRAAREIDASDPTNWIRFGIRSRTIASLENGLNVDSISINLRGQKGWIDIDLRNRPIFPVPQNADKYIQLHRELAALRATKEILEGDITSIKAKAKRRNITEVNGENFRAINAPREGKVFAIFDGNGGRVVADHITENPCLTVSIEESIGSLVTSTREIEDLPDRMSKIIDVRKKIEAISKEIRPIDLGLVERHSGLDKFVLHGVKFTIYRWIAKDYSYPPNIQEKIESGEYEIRETDKTGNVWSLIPVIPVIEIENVEEKIHQENIA